MFWFDLDNSPHVPLFRPVFDELHKRNINYFITARDYAQTKELLDLWGIKYLLVGKHGGKNKFKKILNLIQRSGQLKKVIRDKNIALAVSHGSRTQVVASKKAKIKSVVMLDYEFTETNIFNRYCNYYLMPELIPETRLRDGGIDVKKVIRYNGFKEELYINNFIPDDKFRQCLGVSEDDILITVRTPAMVGNYHDKHSEGLIIELLKYLDSFGKTKIKILYRTLKDKEFIENHFNLSSKINFLNKIVDGLQLIYSSDIFVSGGGTMNRESALLGTKTYSIFTGKKPYLDEYLEKEGKLIFINSVEDIKKIPVERFTGKKEISRNPELCSQIVDILLNLSRSNNRSTDY